MTSNKLKQIAISEDNYNILKKLGGTGDSFNDVLTKILRKKVCYYPSASLLKRQ